MAFTTIIVIIGLLIYFASYFTYGRYLNNKIVGVSTKEAPSKRLFDGVDYIPADRHILFGHHFASIAGAAPVVGPVIALAWGWLPAILWVWFGNIFIGAVHDYLSLICSIRYDGHSIQWIAGKIIKERAGKLCGWFVLLVLILLIAAYSAIVSELHVGQPSVPTVYLFSIIVALFLGYLIYRKNVDFKIATIISLILYVISIIIGYSIPIKLNYQLWMLILLIYIIIVSSLPVNVLLQPRDYLNSWLLVVCLLFGSIIMIFSFKHLSIPTVTIFSTYAIKGYSTPFWPVIPLIIACGSLSGFHSLVASGTTSKQISTENDALFIGYGSMLVEGFLSTVVIATVSAFGVFNGLDLVDKTIFANDYISTLNNYGGPIGVFAKAYGNAANYLFGLPSKIITIIAALWVASFALTTLDTSNRLARYAINELSEPFKKSNKDFYIFITNRWVASALPALIGVTLASSGAWSIIWPAFGGANQMLASIALITTSAWVIRVQRRKAYFVLMPALLLWITVTAALIWYLIGPVAGFFNTSPFQAALLGVITIIMLLLNFMLIYDFYKPNKMIEQSLNDY